MAGIENGRVAEGHRGIAGGLDVSQAQGQRRFHVFENQLERLLLDSAGGPPKLGRRFNRRQQCDIATFERTGHIDGGVGIGQADQGLPIAAFFCGERDVTCSVRRSALVDCRCVQQRASLHGDPGRLQGDPAAVAGRCHAFVSRIGAACDLARVDDGPCLNGQAVVLTRIFDVSTIGQCSACDLSNCWIQEHKTALTGITAGIKLHAVQCELSQA